MAKVVDLTGQKFGRLTVVSFVGVERLKRRWRCKCECGRYSTVAAGNLQSGGVRSCGCMKSEKGARIDVSGRVFGMLTALRPVPTDDGPARWLCQCACGGQKMAEAGALRAGGVISCGCKSKGILSLFGVRLHIAQVEAITNLHRDTIRKRLRRGMSVEEIVATKRRPSGTKRKAG